jgi:hypothetical protein
METAATTAAAATRVPGLGCTADTKRERAYTAEQSSARSLVNHGGLRSPSIMGRLDHPAP